MKTGKLRKGLSARNHFRGSPCSGHVACLTGLLIRVAVMNRGGGKGPEKVVGRSVGTRKEASRTDRLAHIARVEATIQKIVGTNQ